MSADIQIDMSALSPVLHLDLPFLYGPPVQHHPETTPSSDTTSPIMASVSPVNFKKVIFLAVVLTWLV